MSEKRLGKTVDIHGIVKYYGHMRALEDVSLSIAAGEFCTLLGASGSGKTTLLKVVAGFEPVESGSLSVDGKEINHIPVSKRNIGMVFQNYALFPHMSVSANVAFGLETRKVSPADIRRRVDEALTLVGLDGYQERSPRQLSGGQQQRVALARALVIRPDILLMDEPLGALDKNLRQSIQLHLKALHRQVGVTVIYVTHDQEEAMHLSDRIVVMDTGRVVQIGTPQELYFRPKNRFVAGFLGECNFIENEAAGLRGVRPEHLKLGPEAAAARHRIDVVVRDVVFLGSGFKFVLGWNDRTLIATAGNRQLPAVPEIGRSISAGYDDEDALILAD